MNRFAEGDTVKYFRPKEISGFERSYVCFVRTVEVGNSKRVRVNLVSTTEKGFIMPLSTRRRKEFNGAIVKFLVHTRIVLTEKINELLNG